MWKLNTDSTQLLFYVSQLTTPLRNILSLVFQGGTGEKAIDLNSKSVNILN